jgi:hypothetical protein
MSSKQMGHSIIRGAVAVAVAVEIWAFILK